MTDARAAIDAMAQGKVMTIRGASTQDVSLHGAAAALLWIDEKQGRLDTPTALIRRGSRPAALVPIAPPLPTVTPAPAVDQVGFGDQNQKVPAALRARTEVECRVKTAAGRWRTLVVTSVIARSPPSQASTNSGGRGRGWALCSTHARKIAQSPQQR